MGVIQELWNNFHFLSTEQIQGHRLVPLSLRGSHPSSRWSLRHFFATVSGLLSSPALQKSCSVLGSSKAEASSEHLFLGNILILRAVFFICIVFRDRMFWRHVFYIHTIFKSSLLLIRNGCRLYKCLLSL